MERLMENRRKARREESKPAKRGLRLRRMHITPNKTKKKKKKEKNMNKKEDDTEHGEKPTKEKPMTTKQHHFIKKHTLYYNPQQTFFGLSLLPSLPPSLPPSTP